MVGSSYEIHDLPPTLSSEDELVIEPEEIIDTCYTVDGHLEVLLVLRGLYAHESYWLLVRDSKHQFPFFQLEGKLNLGKGSIDMSWKAYYRTKKGEGKTLI